MDCKKVSFKGISLYNATAYVQEHTLINRGITTLGGSTVPQCIMSNNKYEAQERAIMGGVYLIASYLTPIILLPLYNKHFLKNKGITKSVNDIATKIIQVPKKYLTPEGNLKQGLLQTAQKFDKNNSNEYQKAFLEIYERYDNPQKLKSDLLSVHEKILMTDFITTGAMWSSIPWIATEFTEHKTKRTDFSGGFELKSSEQKSKADIKNSKNKKIFWNVLFSLVPGILFSKAITKGLSTPIEKLASSKNPINLLLKKVAKNPQNFDYTSGTNMSKTIYAAIWILSSFPAKLISSRDSNELKDRALRDCGLFTMFFGGDFLINNVLGRFADKVFGTKIMDTKQEDNLSHLEKFKLKMRNFRTLEQTTKMPPELLKKTKTIGAGLYWVSLLTNTALIGFALPKVLNKFLRHNISKEKSANELNHFKNISIAEFLKS